MKKSAINRQRGSIIVPVVVSLLVGFVLLGGVQLGYYFHLKRELQNTADLAALSGVQLLNEGGNVCDDEDGHPAKIAAIANIKENFKQNDGVDADGISGKLKWTVSCGTWDPEKEDNIAGKYVSPQYFEKFKPNVEGEELNNDKVNALRVILSYEPPIFIPTFSSFFGGSSSDEPSVTIISVEAIAKSNEPVAAFQVGSELLRFDKDAVLGRLLTDVGINIESLTLLNPNGVANATITPSGLLGALGVGLGIENLSLLTPEKVAGLDDLTLGELLKFSADLVEQNAALALEIRTLYNALAAKANLGGVNLLVKKIPWVRGENSPGLFAFLGIGDTNSLGGALDVELGLGQVLSTALAVAADGHAIDLDVTLPGLVAAQLFIVEPPVIAIGPVGTTGYTAQIRLWIHLDPKINLGVLETGINLPIAVDIVTGKGTLEKLQCSRKEPAMDVAVEANFLNICVGKMDKANIMSNTSQCHEWLEKEDLVRVIGGLIKVPGKIHLQEDPTKDIIKDLAVGEIDYTKSMEVNVTSVVANLVEELTELLKDLFSSLLGDFLGGGLLGGLLGTAVSLLSPILGVLDTVLTDVLQGVLGLEPGIVDVKALAIGCDPSQLVY